MVREHSCFGPMGRKRSTVGVLGEAELMVLWPESTRIEMVGIQPSLHGYASVT